MPTYVLATAYAGGTEAYVVPRESLPAFFREHAATPLIFHKGADFDLPVIDQALRELGDDLDVAQWIDADLVLDSYLLELLIRLAVDGLAQEELTGQCRLDVLAEKYLGHALDKDEAIRCTFGDFLGLSIEAIPTAHMTYAVRDTVATWHVWHAQQDLLPSIREKASSAYGFQSLEHLDAAWRRFGPLSLFTKVRTAYVFDRMARAGLYSDAVRRDEASAVL